MRRFATVVLAAATLVAQEQPAAPQNPDTEVIHINVNLVQMDAVVTDSKGNLVPNLPASDFEILQDGKPQNITNFSFISLHSTSAAPAPASKNLPKGAVAPPPVPVKPEQARRLIALVVDDLGLSFTSIAYVRNALKKFVDHEMQPGDVVAIIRTGAGMGALQQFTTDKRILYAAIDRVRYNSFGRVGISSDAPLGEASAFDQEREQIFSAGSLGAIRYVVDGLRDLPGRKALVLFSENMRLFYNDGASPRVQQALETLTDAANRSSVVVYTIDPRGLQTHQLTAADDTSGMSARQVANVAAIRGRKEFESRDGLVMLAHDTGGTFQYDNNDIAGALRNAVRDTEGYYLIGYHPAASTFDEKTGQPKFHKVEVKIKTPGLHIRSRTGFLGRSDALHSEPPRGRQAELTHALMSPFNSGNVHLRLTTLYAQTPKGPALDAMMHIDAKDLQFSDQPDGWHKAAIDVAAVTYGADGQPVDSSGKTYNFQLKDDAYKAARQDGLIYNMQVPIKKPGAYQVRIALRDADSEQVGSATQFIDVPDASKGKLTLSSVVLREFIPKPPENGEAMAKAAPGEAPPGSPAGSPAMRVFGPGKDLIYGYQILNAKAPAGQKPEIEAYSRVYRDGQEVFTGKPTPISLVAQTGPFFVGGGILKLGEKMQPGDYVLQIIVNNKSANTTASQWTDFEVR